MSRWIIFFVILILIEFYTFQAIKTSFENKLISRIYLLLSVLIIIFITVSVLNFNQREGLNKFSMAVISVFLLVFIPKLIVSFLLLSEDLFRIINGLINFIFDSKKDKPFLPERRRFISNLALALVSIPVASIIYGIWKGRYNYKIHKAKVFSKDLPDDFDGFKILQLSDIHCGSFDNYDKIKYGIDLINQQDFDMLVFTGDLVNSRADEMDEWLELFKSIKKAEYGKYSIMGNHDYGDYLKWPTKEDHKNNLENVKGLHPKLGWDLLLNENRTIKKGNSKIRIIGVENWGKGGFHKYGDLKKASNGIDKNEFKILLSHDPSHWDLKVRNDEMNYQLTMSGHTHGMQFGIEIPGIKWSLIKYRYPHWAGLYRNKERHLYVNRGFGYLAFPGRIGIWPEITLIELKKA